VRKINSLEIYKVGDSYEILKFCIKKCKEFIDKIKEINLCDKKLLIQYSYYLGLINRLLKEELEELKRRINV